MTVPTFDLFIDPLLRYLAAHPDGAGGETAYVLVIYGSPDVNRTFAATGKTVGIASDGDRFVP